MEKTTQYRPFGILRFALALLVLIQHFSSDIAPDAIKQIIFPLAPGNIAVLAFFILSGFIICEAYHNHYQGRASAYMMNRLIRIVPVYWAALAFSIAVHYALFVHYGHVFSLEKLSITAVHFNPPNILKNMIAIFPPFRVNVTPKEYPFIPYAWALQTEMMFYLTVFFVGAAYPLLKRINNWPNGVWLALAGIGGIAAGVGTELGYLPKQLAYGSYFALGGSLFYVLNGYRKAALVLVPALAQIMWHFSDFAAEDFTTIAANRLGQYVLLISILVLIVILAAARFRISKTDKFFGEYSYPLYLNHYIITVVILNTADVLSATWLAYGLVASLALTFVMFHLIDKPLIRIRGYIRRRKAANIVVTPTETLAAPSANP